MTRSACDQGLEGLCLEWGGPRKDGLGDKEVRKKGEQKESREEREDGRRQARE